jgi:PDZ domain
VERTLRYAKLVLLLLLPLGGLTGCGMVDSMAGYSEAKDLQRVGVPAQAKILAIGETGMSINDEPVIRIDVEVQPADGPPYQATIKRLLISRLEVPQYQPGQVIAVRYDPHQPDRVSIDLGPPPAAKTGNPFADNFVAEASQSNRRLPPSAAPSLYRGSDDDLADVRALEQNGYLRLGVSSFEGGAADPRQAVEQGTRLGAALVVVYGQTTATEGAIPQPLPYHPDSAGSAATPAVADTSGAAATIGLLPPRPPSQHSASYWAKLPPMVLGVMTRALSDEEKARLLRNDGMVVELVVNNSPASGHVLPGDVITAIDGKKILDFRAVSAFLESIAGRNVRIDLLRYGSPLTVDVQLNPLPPA